jgi:hypothetical protein
VEAGVDVTNPDTLTADLFKGVTQVGSGGGGGDRLYLILGAVMGVNHPDTLIVSSSAGPQALKGAVCTSRVLSLPAGGECPGSRVWAPGGRQHGLL